MTSFEDVNGNGLPDLLVHINTETFQLSEGDTDAILEAETYNRMPVRGLDTVRVVP